MLVLSPMCHLQTTIPSCRPVPETKGLFENLKMFDKRYARYNLACRDLGDEDYEWLDVPRQANNFLDSLKGWLTMAQHLINRRCE